MVIMLATAVFAITIANSSLAQQLTAAASAEAPMKIIGVTDSHGSANPAVGLGQRLAGC